MSVSNLLWELMETFTEEKPEDNPNLVAWGSAGHGKRMRYKVIHDPEEMKRFRAMLVYDRANTINDENVHIGGVCAHIPPPPPPPPGPLQLAIKASFDAEIRDKNLWTLVEKQSSRRFLSKFDRQSSKKELSMTTFFPKKCYRGMKDGDKLAYMRMKARDVARDIPYFDNQFAVGSCRLAFELDLKERGYDRNWEQSFVYDSSKLVRMVQKIFPDKKGIIARCLARPPQRMPMGWWKYGLHIVFPTVIVSIEEGIKISEMAKTKFPQEGYVDSVFVGQYARMRPAYARKVQEQDKDVKQYAKSYYRYVYSTDGRKVSKEEFPNVFEELRATSLHDL
jgi:hypothetical protein